MSSDKEARIQEPPGDIVPPCHSEELSPVSRVSPVGTGDLMETGNKTEEEKEGKGLEKLKILLSESGNESVSLSHSICTFGCYLAVFSYQRRELRERERQVRDPLSPLQSQWRQKLDRRTQKYVPLGVNILILTYTSLDPSTGNRTETLSRTGNTI